MKELILKLRIITRHFYGKILLSILIGGLVAILLLFAFSYHTIKVICVREVNEKVDMIGIILTKSISHYLTLHRIDEIEKIMMDIVKKDESIGYIVYRDSSGKIKAHTFKEGIPEFIIKPTGKEIIEDKRFGIIMRKIKKLPEKGLGEIEIGIMAQKLRIWKYFILSMCAILIGVFISVGSIVYILKKTITEKMKQLLNRLKNLAVGEPDLSARLPLKNIHCSHITKCNRIECEVFNGNSVCFLQVGSYSSNPSPDNRMYKNCEDCPVFKLALADETNAIAFYFNIFLQRLQIIFKNIRFSLSTFKSSLSKLLENSCIATQSADKIQKNILEISKNIEESSATHEEIVASMSQIAHITENSCNAIDRHTGEIVDLNNKIDELLRILDKGKYNIEEVTALSQNISTIIEEGKTQLTEMRNATVEVQEKFKKMKKILDIITRIADDTEMLAINASIEAAHAGEYGKGFAVVAEEIRLLSQNTRASAENVLASIEDVDNSISILSNVNKTTKEAFDNIFNFINKIKNNIEKVADNFNSEIEFLNKMIEKIKHSAELSIVLKNAGEETKNSVEEINERVASLQSALEEISSTILSHAEFINKFNELISSLNETIQNLNSTYEEIIKEIKQYKL